MKSTRFVSPHSNADATAEGLGRRAFLTSGLAALGVAALGVSGLVQANTASPALASAPVPSLQFGLDTSINNETMTIGQKYQQVCSAYGSGLGAHTKFFDGGGGWGAAYQNMVDMGWGKKPGEVRPVLCAKTHSDAAFNQLMTTMATLTKGDRWMACFWQEVNDDIRDGAISVAAYRATWVRLDALRKAHPSGSLVRLVPIMNAYVVQDQAAAAVAGGFDTVTLCKGLPIDVIGYDMYDNRWRPAAWDPTKYLGGAAQAAATLGVPWCVPEFGMQVSNKSSDNEAGRAARMQAVINYCKASPTFKWLNYWEGKGANGDWTLVGTPGQGVMKAAM